MNISFWGGGDQKGDVLITDPRTGNQTTSPSVGLQVCSWFVRLSSGLAIQGAGPVSDFLPFGYGGCLTCTSEQVRDSNESRNLRGQKA